MAPPHAAYGDKFRVLEKYQWYNADFSYQAQPNQTADATL
ncbi:hypothetical protein [Zooshikella ganghwensis]